jgi:hypothetical protein
MLSFRGASETSEPGIHIPESWLWIPGPPLAASRNDSYAAALFFSGAKRA